MKKFIVSTIIALVVCAGPALATTVTDTFYGHVLDTTTGTTNDYNYDFTTTGGSVVGLPFTLTVSADTTVLDPPIDLCHRFQQLHGSDLFPAQSVHGDLGDQWDDFLFRHRKQFDGEHRLRHSQ